MSMPVISQSEVWALYEDALAAAEQCLSKLRIASGETPAFTGLAGWVFEQTVQHCLRRELAARGVSASMKEQVKLGRRGKADLLVGDIALEIKLRGIFSQSAIDRYANYARLAHAEGRQYLYLTGGEGYRPYRQGVAAAVGPSNTFFLDTEGHWQRFIGRVLVLLRRSSVK